MKIIDRSAVDRIPLQLLIDGVPRDRSVDGPTRALDLAITGSPDGFGDPHPLFSSAFYRWNNADVAASGVSPWLHYQVFGYREARSPHPLLDAAYLAQWLPDASRLTAVDGYLGSPDRWLLDTSPYLDSESFLLESEPDVTSPPLARILASTRPESWLSFKLLLIDTAAPDQLKSRLTAAAFLVSRHPHRPSKQLESWLRQSPGLASVRSEPGVLKRARFAVVPGYFLGADGRTVLEIGDAATSTDLTLVRLQREYVGLAALSPTTADRLYFVVSAIGSATAARLMSHDEGTVVIAPSTPEQGRALSALAARLGRRNVIVLAHGTQTGIDAGSAEIIRDDVRAQAEWRWPASADPREVTFVVPAAVGLNSATTTSIGRWLGRGASLLSVDETGVNPWPQLLDREHVVIHPLLIESALVQFDDRSLELLNENIVEQPTVPVGVGTDGTSS
jgi:hypothetical protein